jgi:predicted nuclease of restriction endonuclease-like RecB superfamily
MLTGKMVRARIHGTRVVAQYLDVKKSEFLEIAERLLEIFRCQKGRSRGELDEDLRVAFENSPVQLIVNGLAKLLEDRCEFKTVSGHPPVELREAVFARAAALRQAPANSEGMRPPFQRETVLEMAAAGLGIAPEVVENGLFADLKSEQRIVQFADTTAERLLERYNVALAQAILIRSTGMKVHLRNEPPQRYRQLFHLVKFHRLICEAEVKPPDCFLLSLDGPLSLFAATQKYGLQLALFLPAVLKCNDFEVRAELRWGSRRLAKSFTVTPEDGLVSHQPDRGAYVPPELAMFVELFKKRVDDWDILEETSVLPLGSGFWVPDFRLMRKGDGRVVFLEVLGFWRRSSVVKHLERLRRHAQQRFLLAVSDQLKVDDAELADLPAEVYRFRQMPLPDEVVKLARQIVAQI